MRRAMREGVMRGSVTWIGLGGAAWLVRLLLRKPEPEVVVERLAPGERIVVENIGPQRGRRARRATAAAEE